MKEVTKTYEVYNFNELDKEVREKLIEQKTQECQDDYCEYFLPDDMAYYAEELLKKYFGEKAKLIDIHYDLSYCQGSGAMIEFELEYYGKRIKVKHDRGRYINAYTFILDYADYEYLSEKREEQLKDKIVTMNRELEKYGYELIDYENFKNPAEEMLEEEMFLENGEVFNE